MIEMTFKGKQIQDHLEDIMYITIGDVKNEREC